MKRRAYRFLVWLTMAASGSTLFQTYPLTGDSGTGYWGCTRFAANSVGSSINFCWLLDCDNGFFGGLIDPCNDPGTSAWLVDCDNYTGPDDDDTDTTDTTNTTNTTN